MNIVYASDDNFAEIMGISIVSLFENQKHTKDIRIFVLDHGISNSNKEKIKDIFKNYNRLYPVFLQSIHIDEILNVKVETDRGSSAQYARLFIEKLLPKEVQRVLYLDCDIIINEKIDDLWNLDMHDKTAAVLMDAFSKYYRKNINLKPDDLMFNSGVMLIDVKRWKEREVERRLIEFISSHKGIIQQGDQGALNHVLCNDTFCFPPKFNSVTIFYDFTYEEMLVYRKPPAFYKKEEVANAVQHPVIIHYTTSFLSRRPWEYGSKHTYSDVWLNYRKKSPWANEPLREYKTSRLKKIYITLYSILPKWVSLRLSALLQVYGRPLLYQYKNKKNGI